MPIFRMTMRWAGFSGAPGYTNLHLMNPDGDVPTGPLNTQAARVRTFFQGFSSSLPSGVTITFPASVEMLDTGTGELIEDIAIDPLTTVTGAGSGNYSSAVGACINWRTAHVLNGRRLRGRTFIVPLTAVAYQTDGTLSDTMKTTFTNLANDLIAPTDFFPLAIWHKPAPGGTDGVGAQVNAASITDKTAVLRSRRD